MGLQGHVSMDIKSPIPRLKISQARKNRLVGFLSRSPCGTNGVRFIRTICNYAKLRKRNEVATLFETILCFFYPPYPMVLPRETGAGIPDPVSRRPDSVHGIPFAVSGIISFLCNVIARDSLAYSSAAVR